MSYADMAAVLQQANLGASSGGAALALWRACSERELRAWCYEFGFPESLTHTVTIVEIDGDLQVHDAFYNLSYRLGFYDMLNSLRDGDAVSGKRAIRDRKLYIMDPAREPQATVLWLEANADRELEPVDGLRRFELLWNPESFTATYSGIDAVSRDLAARGYPGDLQFLMLHPVAVFDGTTCHRDRTNMPLLGGRDLRAPVAALRVATGDLEAERAHAVEKTAIITRLEVELAEANSRLAQAATDRDKAHRALAVERQAWMQQKVALQAENSAFEGELARTRSQLSAAVDLRAQRDSQVAQLRAEIEDARQQFNLERNAVVALESRRADWEAERLRLDRENRDIKREIEAGAHENEQMRERLTLLKSLVDAAEEHTIEVTHCVAPLIEEVDQLRRDYPTLAAEKDALSRDKERLDAEVSDLQIRIADAVARATALEREIAGSLGSRLRFVWRRFATRFDLLFRFGRSRPATLPPEKTRSSYR